MASLLPLVDELVVNVGKSEDGTEQLIRGIAASNPKIKVIESVWDETQLKDGLVLSTQTNIALDHCSGKWCLYLQADECLHESDHDIIRRELEKEEAKPAPCDAFRFRYLHFYGGYSLIQRSWNWYPSEIRIIRKNSKLRSFGDAQTFHRDDRFSMKLIDARIFHYGHARDPMQMLKKISYFHRFWHGDAHDIKVEKAYSMDLRNLVWYWGSHPIYYRERVSKGLFWTLQPKSLFSEPFRSIVIIPGKWGTTLAHELRGLLQTHGYESDQIKIITKFKDWVAFVVGNLKNKKRNALVDLAAESRSLLTLLLFSMDALLIFKTRIAHIPNGRLSKTRSWFYTAFSYGKHECSDDGFIVPETQYARQILRWLGINS